MHDVQEHINIVKKQYSGIAEDALIAYLLDTTNLCQYEIYKEIDSIEHNYWWASHPKLNK
jgi:hypothetical protein